jgi:hypothetical protein
MSFVDAHSSAPGSRDWTLPCRGKPLVCVLRFFSDFQFMSHATRLLVPPSEPLAKLASLGPCVGVIRARTLRLQTEEFDVPVCVYEILH